MAYIPGKRKDPLRSHSSLNADLDVQRLKRAYQELESLHRQVKESHIEMILNLAIAAEYRDADTGSHILRISDYATLIGHELRLSEDDLEALRYASPMHDIGKIGIPDSILQKTGKLTPAEWEVMKQHTSIGARMFKNSKSPLLTYASEIAWTHHEKFDGSGYPRGLKGDKIPIFGRIVALVDVFDAVVSKRCYKDAWPFEEGFDYIHSLAGGHLDPELVNLFSKCRADVKKIYTANLDIQRFIHDAAEVEERRES